MKVRFYSNMESVRSFWKAIVPDGHRNIYQTYDFNRICYQYRLTSLSNIRRGNLKCCFAVGFREKKPVCIAPLIIDKKPEFCIGLLGTGTNAGKLDFIYNEATSSEDILTVYNACRCKYPDAKFRFYFVPEESPLCEVMYEEQSFPNYIVHVSRFEEYFASLSKSTRQNIRTAYNRMKKEELSYRLEVKRKDKKANEPLIALLNEIYQKRKLVWNPGSTMPDSYRCRMIQKRDVVYQTMRKLDSAQIITLWIQNEAAAFFMGYVVDHRIYVPRLAIAESYEKLSPGMLLIIEYLKTVPNDFVFDLGRGDEGYKRKLQGQVYYTKLLLG